jgi:predicted nucleotidyltransferase
MTNNQLITDNPILQNILTEQPYPLLFVAISGAHLYGFPSHDSDYDLRGVHILPLRDVLGLQELKETIDGINMVNELEIDLVTHDIKIFLELLLKKNGNVLEHIFSPLLLQTSPQHEELKALVPKLLTVHHAHHYIGFSRRKWSEFFDQPPHQLKALLYTYRTLLTGIHLMETGIVEANLVKLNAVYKLPYITDLVAAKVAGGEKGYLQGADLEFHQREYERLSEKLLTAQARSHLPQYPADITAINDLLIRVRLAQ